MSRIERFETIAERLVEGTFGRLFAGRLHPLEVAFHLVRAIEDSQVRMPDGTDEAPNRYDIYVHPDDREALVSRQPAMEEELAHHVAELAARVGLPLRGVPVIRVRSGEGMVPREVRVEARWIPEATIDVDSTLEMEVSRAGHEAGTTALLPGRPFLILEGRRHVNLIHPIVSIGRGLDNDVIIEDARLSRQHAQLRQRYDRYVLYDLGSHGGTKINGYPVEECVLHSGDVISLAGVEIVFGEDPASTVPPSTAEDTPPLIAKGAEPA
jgi:hypothetical protein